MNTERCISCYMDVAHTTIATIQDITNWIDYFKEEINKTKPLFIPQWSHTHLEELKHSGYCKLYNIDLKHNLITLKEGKTEDDIKNNFAIEPVEIIFAAFQVYKKYQNQQKTVPQKE